MRWRRRISRSAAVEQVKQDTEQTMRIVADALLELQAQVDRLRESLEDMGQRLD